MRLNIIVVDNFYSKVDDTRKSVLTANYSVRGDYPGVRSCSYALDSVRKVFQDLIGFPITEWKSNNPPSSHNGAYQLTTHHDISRVQRDTTSWSGVIFLTPDAPVSAGIGFYRHRATGIEEITHDTSAEHIAQLSKDSQRLDAWELVDKVGNRFNRLVLFRGSRFHRSLQHFGEGLEDGMVLQTFFFNTDDSTFLNRSLPKNEIVPELAKKLLQSQQTSSKPPPQILDQTKPNARRNSGTQDVVVHVLIFSTNRFNYLEKMLESLEKYVDMQTNIKKVTTTLIDDYPKRRDSKRMAALVERYAIDELIENPENIGYSASWALAWSRVPADADYIWHQEEDFEFLEEIRLTDLVEAYEQCPRMLSQLTLRRQHWYGDEDYVKQIENNTHGDEITFPISAGLCTLVTQTLYFIPHPGIYPRWVVDVPRPNNWFPQETVVRDGLRTVYPEIVGGVWGSRRAGPQVQHIGEYSQGKRVLPGEPGWDSFKNYDPEKQYSSRNGKELTREPSA